MSSLEKHYSIEFLMEQWDMSENFLRKEIRTGKLKCVHFGSRVKFTQSQIDEYYNKYVKEEM